MHCAYVRHCNKHKALFAATAATAAATIDNVRMIICWPINPKQLASEPKRIAAVPVPVSEGRNVKSLLPIKREKVARLSFY